MCQCFLNISSTFEQYRDDTDNRDNFGHYNRDETFSYRCIPIVFLTSLVVEFLLGESEVLGCNLPSHIFSPSRDTFVCSLYCFVM